MKYIRGCEVKQIDIADDFYDTYKICFSTGSNRIYAIPGFVNGLFACELYLKILIGKKVNKLKGKKRHNLYALFNLLEDNEKEKLISIKNDRNYNLEDLLINIGDGFISWRYIYEDDNGDFGNQYPFLYTEVFLNNYSPILRALAHGNIDQ